jgi:hypothetical protein
MKINKYIIQNTLLRRAEEKATSDVKIGIESFAPVHPVMNE